MTITIRSNIAALKARTQLDRATQGISKSFERLSSGLRINSAVDDAAGLAVSSSLNVDIRISRRGKLNVSDGASAVDIASSAVTQISSLLTRMAELANQSANGTFSDSQRKPIQREYEQLDREIRRIAETTSFNGLDLLKGEQVTSQSAASLFSVLLAGDSSRPSGDGRYVTYNDGNGNIYQHDSQTAVSYTHLTLPTSG